MIKVIIHSKGAATGVHGKIVSELMVTHTEDNRDNPLYTMLLIVFRLSTGVSWSPGLRVNDKQHATFAPLNLTPTLMVCLWNQKTAQSGVQRRIEWSTISVHTVSAEECYVSFCSVRCNWKEQRICDPALPFFAGV